MPVGERPQRAMQAFGKIEFKKLDEASLDQWQADLDQIRSAVDESNKRLDRCERMLAEENLDECKARLDSSASLDPRLIELLDSAASRVVEAELDRIVAELDVGFRVLPEGAIIEAREHRDLIVPRLLGAIKDAIAAARDGEMPEGQAHFFAVFLLTEFQAEEAFPVMLEGFSLAGELPFDLFGDAVHELLKRMLALFLGRRPDAIEALLDDRTLNMYVRWQAASSFLYLVREGHLGRDEAVRRLQRSLRRAIDGHDQEIAGPLVCELLDYAPVEALADIREAFERGLVDEMLVDMRTVERFVAEGRSRLEKELHWCGPATIDTLQELKTWAAFQPQRPARRAGKLAPRLPLEAILPAPHFEADDEPYSAKPEPIVASGPRTGRNDPCPCGSGKKFKKCCGARA
ncbi:MAG TPA: DUF1186 domain-containing protein [Pirellulales bacterium]|nr:DUF1186 domain-containing protein [Pirellulales bacterium]